MGNLFTSAFFAGNRARLRQKTSAKLILVPSQGLMQRNADSSFPFKQDSSFWYLTGVDEPDCLLVMDGPKEYLVVPEREAIRATFDGAIDNNKLGRVAGIKEILDAKTGWKRLGARLKSLKKVAMPLPSEAFIASIGLFTNPARAHLSSRLQALNPGLELVDLRPDLARLRVVKQAPEVAAIQAAVDITVGALESVRKKLSDYKHEYEIEADISGHFRRHGARHAYEPIVAGGSNACTLHYLANSSPVGPRQLILFDVGAEVSNYAADISRTYAVATPTKRQQTVTKGVQEALEFGISLLKPGVTFKDTELKIKDFVGEKLKELGLIKTVDKGSIRKYYPHWPHFLGLDVHDVGNYEWPLQANMVLTLEPGIYIPEEGIGVRLEDDILITERGAKVLSADLPLSLT